jgi:hypothetical protein
VPLTGLAAPYCCACAQEGPGFPNSKLFHVYFMFRFEVKGVVLFVIGIHGSTIVDQEANDTWDVPISNCSIPFTDFKPFIMKYILKRWQDPEEGQRPANS